MKNNCVFIIAEAGVNHNGSLEMALKLIDIAVAAGVNAIKFQSFIPENVISMHAHKAKYQMKNTDSHESQLDMVRKLALSEYEQEEVWRYCREKDIFFISSPFDETSADFLVNRLEVSLIKIPSGEITNAPLLMNIARKQKKIILSTGMSTLGDIEKALGVLAFGYLNPSGKNSTANWEKIYFSKKGQAVLQKMVTLLHCTTEYPASYEDVNLRAMKTLGNAFNLPVGLSDHTLGNAVSIAAVALGATVIEKHFTLDKNLHGPDHRASLDPVELAELVKAIRQVERAMGSTLKKPSQTEMGNRQVVRKSLVASCAIKKGDLFSPNNVTSKRPENGLSPFEYWSIIGKFADRDYLSDDSICNPK